MAWSYKWSPITSFDQQVLVMFLISTAHGQFVCIYSQVCSVRKFPKKTWTDLYPQWRIATWGRCQGYDKETEWGDGVNMLGVAPSSWEASVITSPNVWICTDLKKEEEKGRDKKKGLGGTRRRGGRGERSLSEIGHWGLYWRPKHCSLVMASSSQLKMCWVLHTVLWEWH